MNVAQRIALTNKDATIKPSSGKICMHVLRAVRADYRAMRSATALAKEGFEVSIIDVEHESTQPVEDIDGVQVKHLVIPNWYSSRKSELWFFVVAVQAFILSISRLMRARADVYHASELTALPACFIVSRLLRKPLIFEIYDLQFPAPETHFTFWRRVGAYLYALLLPRCAGIIVTSPFHAQELYKHYRVPGVTLLRNVPTYRTVAKNDRLRHYLGLGPEVCIALYQGNLQPDRGLDKLVRAAAFLERDTVVVLKGSGPSQAQLEALIASEGVADRVKIIPPPPYKEALDWTASADIGLVLYSPDYSLNVRTLLPNKLFEYLMAGLPVLVSPLDAVVDVVKRYDVGQVVSSLSPAAVGAAINAMLADREGRARMQRNALEAAQELCWEKESQQLTTLYHTILAKKKRNG